MTEQTKIFSESSWTIDFSIPIDQDIQAVPLPRYEDTLDNILSLLQYICGELQKTGARFTVISPEAGSWPVDVKTDFCVFIEQVPRLLRFLNTPAEKVFELHLYEQGSFATIEFEKANENFTITCRRLNETSPSVSFERTIGEIVVWQQMILFVWENYRRAVHLVVPQAVEHPFWKSWTGEVNG